MSEECNCGADSTCQAGDASCGKCGKKCPVKP
jgi:hypothetical protein